MRVYQIASMVSITFRTRTPKFHTQFVNNIGRQESSFCIFARVLCAAMFDGRTALIKQQFLCMLFASWWAMNLGIVSLCIRPLGSESELVELLEWIP